ncbi:MAG: alpha/beta hydrolase [Actinomycetota bacterium]|nr:alpha/beta hydrolase [Actinomycetota bacterium]
MEVGLAGGTGLVRQVEGPAGAPVVLLLHGWATTSDVTWGHCYEALAEHYGVLAMDLRGHGKGPPARRLTLEQCADDARSVLDQLAGERTDIAAGYSMGGAIAQLMAKRHPGSVAALVLCVTAARFFPDTAAVTARRYAIRAAESLLKGVPQRWRSRLFERQVRRVAQRRQRVLDDWSYGQICSGDLAAVAGAAAALRSFDSRPWLQGMELPAAIVTATEDRVLPPDAQQTLGRLLPRAAMTRVQGGHDVCVSAPEAFCKALLEACRSVGACGRAPAG